MERGCGGHFWVSSPVVPPWVAGMDWDGRRFCLPPAMEEVSPQISGNITIRNSRQTFSAAR